MAANSEHQHKFTSGTDRPQFERRDDVSADLPIGEMSPEDAVDMKDSGEAAETPAASSESTDHASHASADSAVRAEPTESERDRFLRLAADFDNYKKRVAREYEDLVRSANLRLLRSILDVFDNFDRALTGGASGDNLDAYRKGIELIHSQFNDLLAREKVTAIDALGKPFDPNLHEAVMQMASDEYDEGIICQEVQKGYMIDSRVVRHARVVVSSGRQKTE